VKISELIKRLETHKKMVGDLPVSVLVTGKRTKVSDKLGTSLMLDENNVPNTVLVFHKEEL
jgi:hypothetical protein